MIRGDEYLEFIDKQMKDKNSRKSKSPSPLHVKPKYQTGAVPFDLTFPPHGLLQDQNLSEKGGISDSIERQLKDTLK